MNESSLIKIGLIAYRDHCDEEMIKFHNLTMERSAIDDFILTLKANGGGDIPEAVVDALYIAANEISWRETSQKFLVHILDAPPHGNIILNNSNLLIC